MEIYTTEQITRPYLYLAFLCHHQIFTLYRPTTKNFFSNTDLKQEKLQYQALSRTHEQVLREIQRQALEKNADAIIGYKSDIQLLSQTQSVMVGYGIAIHYKDEHFTDYIVGSPEKNQQFSLDKETDNTPLLPSHLQEKQVTILQGLNTKNDNL